MDVVRLCIAFSIDALAGWMPRVFAEVAGEHWCHYLMAGTTFGSRTTRSTFHPAARLQAGVGNG